MNGFEPRVRAPARPGLVALALAWACSGCGGGGESVARMNAAGAAKQVSDVIEDFNESSTVTRRMAVLFAKGRAPQGDALKRFGRYSYFPTSEARVAGDSAAIGVSLREEKTGQDLGPLDWTLVKEGDAWKIATAPLP